MLRLIHTAFRNHWDNRVELFSAGISAVSVAELSFKYLLISFGL